MPAPKKYVSQSEIEARDKERIRKAKSEQDFDPDPPRCFTCLYYQRRMTVKRARKLGVPNKEREINLCTFGNFKTSYQSICNEWRTRKGERLEN